MKIAGLVRTTLIDYPDKIASIIFLSGCNFRCGFCHNSELVTNIETDSFLDFYDVLAALEKRKNLVNSIVISGGEPTLNKNLIPIMTELKKRGYSLKLDTNGTNPEVISELISNKLVDYIAMDIKTSLNPEKYNFACGTSVDLNAIKESIALLMDSSVEYEFRTTMHPKLVDEKDINEIGIALKGSKKIALQQYKKGDKVIDIMFNDSKIYDPDEFNHFKDILSEHIDIVEIRGI